VKRDHSDKKNERISRVSYHLVLCHCSEYAKFTGLRVYKFVIHALLVLVGMNSKLDEQI